MKLKQILMETDNISRKLTSEESLKLKTILLEMYKDILSICNEIGVTCMLSGGSCLGAVRHKGFIPWDDDMDLMMLRDDYEKLLSVLHEKYSEKYTLVAPRYNVKNCHSFCKIEKRNTSIITSVDALDSSHGIGIDLFPIESVPQNSLLRFFHGLHVNALLFISSCTQQVQHPSHMTEILKKTSVGRRKLFIRNVIGNIFSFKKSVYWYERTNIVMSKYHKSNLKSIPSGRGHYFGEMHNSNIFSSFKEVLFENIPSYIPAGYDLYLKKLYGNYLEIPPEEKRESHFIIQIDFGDFFEPKEETK